MMLNSSKIIRPSFSKRELWTLAHILHHFTDYMAFDDRDDHGLAILKEYRFLPDEKKREIYLLAGRLIRLNKKKNR